MRAGGRYGPQAQAFRDRLGAAFAKAMTGQHEPDLASERAQFLTAATFGIWLTARIDPASAAQACDSTTACVRSWPQAPAGPGSLSRNEHGQQCQEPDIGSRVGEAQWCNENGDESGADMQAGWSGW